MGNKIPAGRFLNKIGGDPLDIAVCAVVTALQAIDRTGICPDDARIFDTIHACPQSIRESINRLVFRKIFKTGDGYLRQPERVFHG